MHNGGAISLAAIIALILLGCGSKRRSAFLAVLVVLAVIIVCGCSGFNHHHH